MIQNNVSPDQILKEQADIKIKLEEQIQKQKYQMRNACKNLSKVDEFLTGIQARKEKQKEFYKGPKSKVQDMIINE